MTSNQIAQQKLAQVKHLAQQKQIPQALKLAEEVITEFPDFASAWFTIAFLLFQSNQVNQAADAIKAARKLEPENPNFAFQEVLMYDSINRPDIATSLAQELAKQTLTDIRMIEQLARVLELNEDFDGALKLYNQLHNNQPNHVVWLLKQATMYQNMGKIETAEQLSTKALAMAPQYAEGQFFNSHLTKKTPNNNNINSLKALCDLNYPTAAEKAKIYFSLAKELEDCHQYADSFTARKTGAELYRQSFQYDLQSDIDFMRQIQIEFDADFVSQKTPGSLSDAPIFIVGLPRSGTTLLDRIITSHSDVKAAGELKQFNRCMLQGLQLLKINPRLSRTELVTASRQLDFPKLGRDYLQTASHRTADSPRFTDKFPQNSYYVGMILKALPNAKVIVMQRNSVAVCYSVYKQLFSNDSYPFSYDLKEMAAYYNQHNTLLKHWQAIGGDAVKTIYYEDLVGDLENQAKDIMRFLNLDWQPQCLDFHKNRQPTATASSSQVRQKLYTGSVELWRQYEPQLKTLIDSLEMGNKE
jgi:tetratricopeptide (TPR) repeat protein